MLVYNNFDQKKLISKINYKFLFNINKYFFVEHFYFNKL